MIFSITKRATTDPDQIVSNIFSRKKKSAKVRITLNLLELNKDIKYHKFKMETAQSVLDMVRSGFFSFVVSTFQTPIFVSMSGHNSENI